MADKISSYGRIGHDISQARAGSVAKTDRAAGPGAKDRSDAPHDAVELTDTATNLKRIEARLTDVSDVDPQRVDAMRKRIESGDYQVDHEKLAQKLLKLEQDLT